MTEGRIIPCRVMRQSPGSAGFFGDPRGCLHRSNISMIIMHRRSMGIAAGAVGFIRGVVIRWRGDVEQFASERGAGLAGGAGEQASVPNAVEGTRQNIDEEAVDELVGCEPRHLLTVGATGRNPRKPRLGH